jgi:hypothetical protein
MKRKRVAIILAMFSAIVLGFYLYQFQLPSIDSGGYEKITIVLDADRGVDQPVRPLPITVETVDAEAIAELLGVLKSRSTTSEHKCGDLGKIQLHRKFGSSLILRYLPGHDENWYEFRIDGQGIFKVKRPEFVNAMKRIGIDVPLKDN